MKDYTIVTIWGKSVGGKNLADVKSQTLWNRTIKRKIKKECKPKKKRKGRKKKDDPSN